MSPYGWAYCLTVYDAGSREEAESAEPSPNDNATATTLNVFFHSGSRGVWTVKTISAKVPVTELGGQRLAGRFRIRIGISIGPPKVDLGEWAVQGT